MYLKGQTHALKFLRNGTVIVGTNGTHYDRCAKFNCFEHEGYPEFYLFFPEVVFGFNRQSMPDVDRLLLVH